jgi:hypothetical protein
MGPKITCICNTQQKRATVFGVAAASFATQTYDNKELIVGTPQDETDEGHRQVAARLGLRPVWLRTESNFLPDEVERHCKLAFERGADIVAVWDDDDAKLPNWLETIAAFPWDYSRPCIGGATFGWFANLRSLNGVFFDTHKLWGNDRHHIWGGSQFYNRAAWKAVNGFAGRTRENYDRDFQHDLEALPNTQHFVLKAEGPMAGNVYFVHGNNTMTVLSGPGEDLSERFRVWYAGPVWDEFARVRDWMVERRIYPPHTTR